MRTPKFRTEKQEADWLYAHRKQIERGLSKETKTKSLSVAGIIERQQTKAISIRLAVSDIEQAKKQAEARGVGYQTLIRMMIHESLRKA